MSLSGVYLVTGPKVEVQLVMNEGASPVRRWSRSFETTDVAEIASGKLVQSSNFWPDSELDRNSLGTVSEERVAPNLPQRLMTRFIDDERRYNSCFLVRLKK